MVIQVHGSYFVKKCIKIIQEQGKLKLLLPKREGLANPSSQVWFRIVKKDACIKIIQEQGSLNIYPNERA